MMKVTMMNEAVGESAGFFWPQEWAFTYGGPMDIMIVIKLLIIYTLIGLMISVINNSWSKIQDDGNAKLPGMRWIQVVFSIVWWLPGICIQYVKRARSVNS